MAFHTKTLLFAALLPVSIQLACAEIAIPSGFEDLAKKIKKRMYSPAP
ncbi:hypothetical protein [Citrobacter amalonaticus]|nr:hypothetical protein [Citrobacter amalonaticus]